MDITEAIDRVLELAPARVLSVGGFDHVDKDKNCTLFLPPMLSVLQVATLSGFVGLLEDGFEDFVPENALVHVADCTTVKLLTNTSDKLARRTCFITATAPKPEREFRFNQYYPQEEFNIALRSMFVETDELNGLVAIAGNIAKNSELRQVDDGFAQEVSAKTGIAMVKTITIKPKVTLKPFRTFLEVDQPEGEYVFRVKSPEGGNQCALFEADAGRWKLTAMNSIAEWLKQKIKTSEIDAINGLTVIV